MGEVWEVVRYQGTKNIMKMMEREEYVEAFVHTQLGVEKILWDKIIGIFDGEKAMKVRRAIEKSEEKNEDRSHTNTYELIKWATFLGAINTDESKYLKAFNRKRNKIIHGHGEWWHFKNKYKQALQKTIQFLEKNGL